MKQNVSFHTISYPTTVDFETTYEIEHGINGKESSAVINWYCCLLKKITKEKKIAHNQISTLAINFRAQLSILLATELN